MVSEPPHHFGTRVSATPEPTTGLLVLDGPLALDDVPRLCERLHAVLRAGDVAVVVCDVGTLPADAVTIEVLARLQLTARRLGGRIRLQRASCELDRLLAFAGLAGVLPSAIRDDALP